MNLILGAGLAGLSASYHLGHEHCLLLEKKLHPFGHIHSELRDGFTWDQGPHVSFTKYDYVKQLFSDGVDGEFDEYEVKAANYYKGHWIDHPAQTSLYQLPEPLRSECVDSFLKSRATSLSGPPPSDYAQWLERAFGPKFAQTFPHAYTRKYWTREARDLTTDWVGGRIFYPDIEDVIAGSKGPLGRPTHYIGKVRYPKRGGYQSFARKLAAGALIRYGAEVSRIDLKQHKIWTTAGDCYSYTRLINTLPLPIFVQLCAQVTRKVLDAVKQLSCSQLLLVNVTAPHPTRRPENWIYVYDEDKLSTRINCTEKLTSGNAPAGHTGVQVEVYFSRPRPLPDTPEKIGKKVQTELVEMGLINADCSGVNHSIDFTPWANVIFDHNTRPALRVIWGWLEEYGLEREEDDLSPLTDWGGLGQINRGTLVMAGRFGQWKYYWTDDCVLRGASLSKSI